MKLIGIDPGVTATGYSIIKDGIGIASGTVRPKKGTTHNKIFEICTYIRTLIEQHKPDFIVLEKVFHRKNIQSLIRSSELRGAIILASLSCNTKILEYTPAQIKLTATGNGRASKQQVRYFIERVVLKDNKKISSHAIDALAIAYTAARKLRCVKQQ